MRLLNFILLFIPLVTFGQLDTNIVIEDVVVTGQVIDAKSLIKQPQVDRKIDHQLERQTSIYVKNHGPSQISTISHRGGNASQTTVMWNGIPIANPMLGLTDVSLIDGWMVDRVSVSDHDQSISSLSGEVTFESMADDETKLQVLNTIGSFGMVNSGIKGVVSRGNWSGDVRIIRYNAENDFPYDLTSGDQRITEHASESRNGIQFNNSFDLSDYTTLTLHNWWQETYREIPPRTTQTRSEENQYDKSLRNSIGVSHSRNEWSWKTNVGYTSESLLYKDPVMGLENFSAFDQWFFSSEVSKKWNEISVALLHKHQWVAADIAAYDGQKNQQLYRSELKLNNAKNRLEWLAQIGRVGDLQNNNTTYKVGSKYWLQGDWSISASASNAFRYPSTNDLFWGIGGNENLLPEAAQKFELNSSCRLGNEVVIDASFFYRDVDNSIMWGRPEVLTQNWQVYNLTRVISHGIEASVDYNFIISDNSQIRYNNSTTYVRSINQVDVSLPSIEKGDQLFYTPIWKSRSNIDFKYKNNQFSLGHIYTGSTIGVESDIPSFQLVDLVFGRNVSFASLNLDLSLSCNNILNQQYRIVERRPMPGRNYQFSLITTLSK